MLSSMSRRDKRPIRLGRGLILDPSPMMAPPILRYNFASALRELEYAKDNPLVMTDLRHLFLAPANDTEVLRQTALMVANGSAVIRLQLYGGGLPWAQILKDLKQFEGTVNHMYVDSKGYVTVGVGKMLPSADEAKKLGFVVRATGAAATGAQIAADYAKVKAQPMNHLPSFYKSDLDLPQSEIDRLLKEIAERCDKEVAAQYSGYEKYPIEVRQVLIDMRFNMGGNMDKFVKFKKAIESAYKTNSVKDWQTAASESYRKDVGGPDQARNAWARAMILKGGGVKQ